ncbi:unnamed protein product [Rotaria sp. Silwood1]|nr:unnamed protein product [Rotaria sp. Silwood1]CAF1687804.1 unnamed protein product [Rotaria sp. Silwood1]
MYVEFIQIGNTNKISAEVENHCYKYSHVCSFGRQCKTKGEKHFETSIHIARKICSDIDKRLQLTDEEHLESFSHPGIRDIRLVCLEPGYVAKAVRQHSRIRLIFLKHNIPAVKDNAFRLITALVEAEFAKKKTSDGTTPLVDDHDYAMKLIEKKLIPPLTDHDISIIHQWAKKIAQESIKLHENPMGIGYIVDRSLGTDKHVFSILGPHLGHYYGDIIIVFKKEIMFHPDANFSIQAGTSFGPSGNAYKRS